MDLFKLIGTIAINSKEAISEIEGTTKSAEKSESKIASAFKKIGTAVATYFAVGKIKSFGSAIVEAAANADASAAQFTQVFGEYEAGASWWLSAVADNAGITENRMKDSFTKIAAFAKTSGMDTEAALTLSTRAMVAVADSAAFYDRTLEATTESLQSFLKGNYENDAALGLSCTETTRNAAANKLYGKSFNDLSESQKQLTLLKMVEDANELSGALGQAARESNTWTNQTGNLKQKLTDLKATIGKHVLPTAVNLVAKFSDFVEKIETKVDPAIDFLSEKFGVLKARFAEIRDYAKDKFEPIITDVSNAFEIVKSKAQAFIDKLRDYFAENENAESITNRIKDAINYLADAYETIKEKVIALIDKFPEYITSGELMEDVTNRIKDSIDWLQEKVEAVKDKLQPYIDKMSEYVESGKLMEDVTNAIKDAVGILIGVFSAVKDVIQPYIDKVAEYVSSGEAANDITETFKNTVEWLKDKFTAAKEALQPYIDALCDYVESGELANDVADGLKTALEFIGEVIGAVVNGVTAFSDWCLEHTGTLETIAIIIGSIATAIGLVEAALTLANAVTVVWTAISTAASIATSALASAVAFLTSPITIAIAIIAAIIAVGVLLWKNWDTIKAKCVELAAKISEKFEEIKTSISDKVTAAKEKVVEVFTNIKDSITEKITAAKEKVQEIFTSIQDSITEKINAAKEKVSAAIDAIKSFFNFEFSWPNLPLPHFSISPSGWKIGDLLKGSIPSLGIDWYAKAVDDPVLMEKPTPFGVNKNGQIMAGGETESEVVSGTAKLMEMISQAVASQNAALITVLELILIEIRKNNHELADSLREALEGMSFRIQNREFARLVKAVT